MGCKGKFLTQEPRLCPVHVKGGGACAVAEIHIEALTSTAEVSPVGDVEVRLRHGDKTDEAINRTEACTEVHGTCGFFRDVYLDIFKADHFCRNRANGQRVGISFTFEVI